MTKQYRIGHEILLCIKKISHSTEVEMAWSGKVWDIMDVPGKIFFRVEIEKEIECPEEYLLFENGWYFE